MYVRVDKEETGHVVTRYSGYDEEFAVVNPVECIGVEDDATANRVFDG